MIESSFLNSSAWDSDLFQDFVPDIESSGIFDAVEYVGNFDSETKPSSCSVTPDDLSSASSSDYEWLGFDDLNNILPISDTFVSQILEEEEECNLDFSDLNLVHPDSPVKHTASTNSSNLNHASSTPKRKKRRTKSSEYLSSSKSWSKMSSEEQLQMLHALSEIVTRHMGIREQIEVIRIIDPSAVISPEDKEFALDSSYLNDTKLKRIKDFVKKHTLLLSNSSKPISSSSSNLLSSKKATNSTNTRFHPTKRRSKKQKIPFSNEIKVRERKVKRQGKKEEQSGLFVYEKKIKKHNDPSEEDEDVNILE